MSKPDEFPKAVSSMQPTKEERLAKLLKVQRVRENYLGFF